MRKKALAILTAATLMLAGGCGSDKDSTTSGTAPEATTAATEAVTEEDTDTEEIVDTEEDTAEQTTEGTKNVKSLRMSMNRSGGKMNISRAEDKSTPMGEDGTWTIFVYLCGTDLESSGQGSATSDLNQMMSAQGSDNVRFVMQTGGTNQWINDYFSSEESERWVVQNGNVEKVDSVELANMGNAESLTDFLNWGISNYPASKMGLVFWDHGGGSISGVCVDELNEGDTLTLPEINSALAQVYENMTDKFEFIGFDCCLMGTAETANILATYARYFYGSQETEPGSGWDYTTYGTYIAENPDANGGDLGKVIADSFYDECASGGQENGATLTILDLEKMDNFTIAFNDYAQNLYNAAQGDLSNIVRAINSADNFGGNNESEGYTNMVDIGGIVNGCSSYADGSEVLSALNDCVVYNKNGSDHANASGLSIYYPLKSEGSKELKTFAGICISPYYLSLVDMVSKGYSEDGYNNDSLFSEDGEWSVDDCEGAVSDEYFDYADEEKSGESTLITFAAEPSVDENGSFGFSLDENGLNYAASVYATIYMKLDEEQYVALGETNDLNIDWESGTFADNFDGYWMSLSDGTLLTTHIVDVTDEYTVYTSPVMLNGNRTNLRIRQYSDSSTIVEGAWDGIGSNGMAAREIKKLSAGDRITPIYFMADGTEHTEDEYEWKDGDTLAYALMTAGDYLYTFNIKDAYGDMYTSGTVTFNIDEEGNVSFVEQ